MVQLRPRERKAFTGFTAAEIEKMENLLQDPGKQSLDQEFFKKLTKRFNWSKDRAGKPALKWAEIQDWFLDRQKSHQPKNGDSLNSPQRDSVSLEGYPSKSSQICVASKGDKLSDLTLLEFEARSATDGAWYDVETFLTYRFYSGEAEVLVRYVGFSAEDDEWVNVKKDVRERSLPLEHSECGKVKVGDAILCFQESRDREQAKYFDAHVVSIQRKMHDIRGCRCLFSIRYDHDTIEERVQLGRLCRRPSY